MPSFLVECSHADEHEGCVRALDAVMKHGSHLMTSLKWGCKDGVHSGWIIADLDDRSDALRLIPPQYRKTSRVVQLNLWSREEIDTMVRELNTQG
jgi:hypothetical protein